MSKHFSWALALLLLASSAISADVIFTDQEYQELGQIMDQLEILNTKQQTTIDNLKKQNENLQIQSDNKQKILEEQEKTLQQQETLLKKEKKSSTITAIISNIITAVISLIIGVLV